MRDRFWKSFGPITLYRVSLDFKPPTLQGAALDSLKAAKIEAFT